MCNEQNIESEITEYELLDSIKSAINKRLEIKKSDWSYLNLKEAVDDLLNSFKNDISDTFTVSYSRFKDRLTVTINCINPILYFAKYSNETILTKTREYMMTELDKFQAYLWVYLELKDYIRECTYCKRKDINCTVMGSLHLPETNELSENYYSIILEHLDEIIETKSAKVINVSVWYRFDVDRCSYKYKLSKRDFTLTLIDGKYNAVMISLIKDQLKNYNSKNILIQ